MGHRVNWLRVGDLVKHGLCWAQAWAPVSTHQPVWGQPAPRASISFPPSQKCFKTSPVRWSLKSGLLHPLPLSLTFLGPGSLTGRLPFLK